MKKISIIATGILLVLVVGFVILRGEQRPDLRNITVAQFGDLLLYMPLYIAQDQGLFRKHGLAVKIVSTGGDDKTYAAVISGDAQFGIADPTFVAIAAERGVNGKVVGLLINGMPNYGVALTATSPVTSPSQLRGKTVATVPAPSTSYALMKGLYELAGIEPQIRQVAPAGLVAAVKAGEADYALLIEPWVSAVALGGGTVVFSLNDYYKDFALTGITASDTFIAKDRPLITNFLAAMAEAVELFYSDADGTLKIAKTRFPSETEESLGMGLERMRKDQIYPRQLSTPPAAWEAAVELRRKTGDLSRPVGPMSNYVDDILPPH